MLCRRQRTTIYMNPDLQGTCTQSFSIVFIIGQSQFSCGRIARVFSKSPFHFIFIQFILGYQIIPEIIKHLRFCPSVPVHKGIIIVFSLFRSHWLAVVHCLVLCSGTCEPVHEDRNQLGFPIGGKRVTCRGSNSPTLLGEQNSLTPLENNTMNKFISPVSRR